MLPTLAGLATIGVLAWYWRDAIGRTFSGVVPSYFVLALLAGLLLSVLQGLLFSQLMHKNGATASTRELLTAFLVSQPGKYVPGKIWGPLLQHFSLGGATPMAVTAIANVELAVILLIQVTALGIACLGASIPMLSILVIVAATLAGTAVIRLRPIPALLQRLPRLAARLGVPEARPVRPTASLTLALALTAAATCAALLASWLVVVAVGPAITAPERLPALGTLFLGFASSLLVVPVPAGLGVREAATVGVGALIAPALAASQLVSLAIFFRCWQLLVDLACVALGALLSFRGDRRR